MTIKQLEEAIAKARQQGATDDTLVYTGLETCDTSREADSAGALVIEERRAKDWEYWADVPAGCRLIFYINCE